MSIRHMKNIAEGMTAETAGWISCKDKMPEAGEEVLVTYTIRGAEKRRYVETASWYDGSDGHWSSVWDEYMPGAKERKKMLAWQPLPEPYRGD